MPETPAGFMHISSEFAYQVGQKSRKDQVVILGFDHSSELISTATWGRSAEDKQIAFKVGVSLTAAAGGHAEAAMRGEDFRDQDAAERAVAVDQLLQRVQELQSFVREAAEILERYAGPAAANSWVEEHGLHELLTPVA